MESRDKPEEPKVLFSAFNWGLKVTKICFGVRHVVIADQHGIVYSKGFNDLGQLGLGFKSPYYKEFKSPSEVNIRSSGKLSCLVATSHATIVCFSTSKETSVLFSWGSGFDGELGLGENCTTCLVPRKICAFERDMKQEKRECSFTQIFTSSNCVIAIMFSKWYVWGNISQYVSGIKEACFFPIQIDDFCVLNTANKIYCLPSTLLIVSSERNYWISSSLGEVETFQDPCTSIMLSCATNGRCAICVSQDTMDSSLSIWFIAASESLKRISLTKYIDFGMLKQFSKATFSICSENTDENTTVKALVAMGPTLYTLSFDIANSRATNVTLKKLLFVLLPLKPMPIHNANQLSGENVEKLIEGHFFEEEEHNRERKILRCHDCSFYTHDQVYKLKVLGRKLADDNFILEAKRLFYKYDEDISGQIDVNELHSVMKGLGFKWLTMKKCAKIIRKFDTDGNGRLGEDEFLEWISELKETSYINKILKTAVPIIFGRIPQNCHRVSPKLYSYFREIVVKHSQRVGTWTKCRKKFRNEIITPSSSYYISYGILNLECCGITDEQLASINIALSCIPIISEIRLSGNNLSPDGINSLLDVMKTHDELAEYQDCAKCVKCGKIIPFDDVLNLDDTAVGCACTPISRGGYFYKQPVYFLESVCLDDKFTNRQILSHFKIRAFDSIKSTCLRLLCGNTMGVSKKVFLRELELEQCKFIKEFSRFCNGILSGEELDAEIERLFKETDLDGSGYIDYSEFVQLASKLGLKTPLMELSKKRYIKKLLQEYDTDDNAQLSLSEFSEFVKATIPSSDVKFFGKQKNAHFVMTKQKYESFAAELKEYFSDVLYPSCLAAYESTKREYLNNILRHQDELFHYQLNRDINIYIREQKVFLSRRALFDDFFIIYKSILKRLKENFPTQWTLSQDDMDNQNAHEAELRQQFNTTATDIINKLYIEDVHISSFHGMYIVTKDSTYRRSCS